tara:strand:+ start:166 stop:666 length:501 start_codon:yes stop_codon:yes gene_type:complete
MEYWILISIALFVSIGAMAVAIYFKKKADRKDVDFDLKLAVLQGERDNLATESNILKQQIEKTIKDQHLLVKEAREDAIKRSKSVISGKIKETIAPYLPDFPYNPKDCRFIGTPNDFIVFDGMDEGEIKQVVILEIKSGTSSLSTRQRNLRDAVKDGRVEWAELKL